MSDAGESGTPYPPSFVDRLTDWVRRLPLPWWLFYLLGAVLMFGAHVLISVLDGSYSRADTLSPQSVLSAVTAFYAIGLLHYLDTAAKDSLDDFRPAMDVSSEDFEALRYRFTTLPRRPALIAAGIGGLYGATLFVVLQEEFDMSPVGIALQALQLVLGYGCAGLLVYHSVRQLRMVHRIYADYARVDLFNLAPVHSLSRLSARTAIGIFIVSYAWTYVNLEAEDMELTASIIYESIFNSLVVIGIFVWPLMGARRLLRGAKRAATTEASQQFKATVEELHRRREAGEYGDLSGLNDAMDGLLKELSVVEKTSTWPWQAETVRGVATAIVLPIMLWFITTGLERVAFT